MKKLVLLLVALAAFVLPGNAQQHTQPKDLSYYLPEGVSYNPAVPTPASVLGYEVGRWHVSHDLLVKYMERLAEASDRVTLKVTGRTHEARPLLLLTITAPGNHQKIDQIKATQQQLADPQRSSQVNLDNHPAVVWMGYSVHGNEASAVNASLLTAYYLAAAQGPAIEKALQNTVVLVDPAVNPDGVQRFSTWVNSHQSYVPSTDGNHREHDEAYPGGRTNHYWFDLNRDWLLLQHPSSRARIKQFHDWHPLILTDHHEMGTNSTFFFQPGIPSRNNPLTPARTFELTEAIAQYHAKHLDSLGSYYYSKESFDDFYYGKGSTYPDVHGAVGILFEQASSRGHLQSSVNGDVSFPFTIKNQFATSLSTFEAAQNLRQDLQEHKRNFYKSAMDLAAKDNIKAYGFGSATDPVKAATLVQLLRQHQIRVYQAKSNMRLQGDRIPANQAYVVPTNQPQYRLIKAVFEQRTTFTDSLFYDISAWTLPLAFDLNFEPLTGKSVAMGAEVTMATLPQGMLDVSKAANYAYVFEWKGYLAPRAAYKLMAKGLRLKVATKPFTANGRRFDYGTVLVPVQNRQPLNEQAIFGLMQGIAKEEGINVYALNTGLTEGIDLGSPSFTPMRMPKVMIMAGSGVSSYEAGEAWHLLDQRYKIPVSLVELGNIRGSMLANYNTIIMPSGSYGGLSKNAQEELKRWVRGGGTIVAWKYAARWLSTNGFTKLSFKSRNATDNPEQRPYNLLSRYNGAQYVGGAIFQARADLSHPLAYGLENAQISLFRNHTLFMEVAQSAYANPFRYTANPLQAGYISKENLEMLGGTAAVQVSALGRGRIISWADNPNFRAFWYGTNRLTANSLFFGNIISGGATR